MSTDTKTTKAGLSETGRVLTEALPYILRYDSKTIVVKYGGHAMGEDGVSEHFAQSLVLMKQTGIDPVVVHGGGPQIGAMLDRLAIKSEFIDGLRVTDTATVEVVEMVLSGTINKQIVASINAAGGHSVGLSGKDGNLIVAEKLRRTKKDPDSNIEKVLDLGFVGEPKEINPGVLEMFAKSDIIPVVAPVGIGRDGQTYNVNADTAAGAIAGALGATRFYLLTDVMGVLDKDGKLMPELTLHDVQRLIGDHTIKGGMIPKVETCVDAVKRGVEAGVILDGRIPHVLLLEIFTDHGIGTMIRKAE